MLQTHKIKTNLTSKKKHSAIPGRMIKRANTQEYYFVLWQIDLFGSNQAYLFTNCEFIFFVDTYFLVD